ncbi:MAG: right-handed parallel beta-helix repeat-containing protein, partial [Flavobacteriales bacterium]
SISDSIVFTAADTTNGWYGIRFDNTPSTNDTSRLEYCGVFWGNANGSGNDLFGGGINFNHFSKARISSCRISHNKAAKGGGIYLNASSPVISGSVVSLNEATGCGGGIYCDTSNPRIIGNSISRNSSLSGGAICSWASNPIIAENNISNNSASYGGGAIYASGSSADFVISHNVINENSAGSNNAGGIYIAGPVHASISYNTISYNVAHVSGGGIVCYSNNNYSTISYNHISNNTALQDGGGIACFTDSDPNIHNNTITNNSASTGGGGIYFFSNASPSVINNTISNNHCSGSGGAIFCIGSSSPSFLNCILYGNTATLSGSQVYLLDEPSDPDFLYCDVMGGVVGFELNDNFFTGAYMNNTDTVPMFVAPSAGAGAGFDGVTSDWSLLWNSPCIDAGDPAGIYTGTDIAGNSRVIGGRVDMGAYEFAGTTAIEEGNSSVFEVRPNPTSGTIVVKSPTGPICTMITLLDAAGRTLQSENLPTHIWMFDLGNYERGLYFVRMDFVSGHSLVERVIKQ